MCKITLEHPDNEIKLYGMIFSSNIYYTEIKEMKNILNFITNEKFILDYFKLYYASSEFIMKKSILRLFEILVEDD